MKSKKWVKIWFSILGIGIISSTTLAISLPLYIKSKAEKFVGQFLPIGGEKNDLKNQPINYVALGDSLTSGYNAHFAQKQNEEKLIKSIDVSKTDYLSYADFIANDLHKANRLKDYRNFATSGETIPQQRNRIFREPSALAAIKKANLITLSIGANDLLSIVEVLKIPYNSLAKPVRPNEKGLNAQKNNYRDLIPNVSNINSSKGRIGTPSGFASEQDNKNLIIQSYEKLINILKNKKYTGIIDIEKELYEKLFDILKVDLGTFIKELNQAAPNAKIILVGYPFPLHHLPSSFINNELKNKQISIKGIFDKFLKIEKGIVSKANYVQFFNANEWKEFTDKSDQVTFQKIQDDSDPNNIIYETKKIKEWNRAMANPADIHPSTYGHQIIGNKIFDWILNNMKFPHQKYETVQNIEPNNTNRQKILKLKSIYTYANIDPGFKIFDENKKYDSKVMAFILDLLKKWDNKEELKNLANIILNFIDKVKLSNNYQDVMQIIKSSDGMSTKIIKFIKFFQKIKKDNAMKNSLKDLEKIFSNILPEAFAKPFGNVSNNNIPLNNGKILTNFLEIISKVKWNNLIKEYENNGIKNVVQNLIKDNDANSINGLGLWEALTCLLIYFGDKQSEQLNHNDINMYHLVQAKVKKLLTNLPQLLPGSSNKDVLKNVLFGLVPLSTLMPTNHYSQNQWVKKSYNDGNFPIVPANDSQKQSELVQKIIDDIIATGKKIGIDISSFFNLQYFQNYPTKKLDDILTNLGIK